MIKFIFFLTCGTGSKMRSCFFFVFTYLSKDNIFQYTFFKLDEINSREQKKYLEKMKKNKSNFVQ